MDGSTDLLSFKVKLLNDQKDVAVAVSRSDSCDTILKQIRSHTGWDASKHVRLICSGKELYPGDPVTKAGASVLHCIATDGPAPGHAASRKSVHAAGVEQPPLDWLDVVDPGTVLMWIFGSILALLWLLFICYASMFDKTSVVMLCIMTVAFLIPCVLSYLPWLSLVHSQPRGTMRPLSSSNGSSNPGYGSSGRWGGGTRQQQSWGSRGHAGGIPPRPVPQKLPPPTAA